MHRILRSSLIWGLVLVAISALLFWSLTRALEISPADLPDHQVDLANGERMFIIGGCTSCHEENLRGGMALTSEFGIFHVPNISPDPDTGIGNWSTLDLVNAMMLGTSPEGRHYYPSFPYPSYTRMKVQDVMDLKAYLDTREAVRHAVPPNELRFPWNMRRAIGLWKMMYLKQGPVVSVDPAEPLIERGRYLAEGPGHCGECHTPRNFIGGPRLVDWLAGGPNPDGEGTVPNITPDTGGLGSWSESDIAYYFDSGFTPDFDTVGGSMVKIQEHLARLPEADRKAIAAYLKFIPARP